MRSSIFVASVILAIGSVATAQIQLTDNFDDGNIDDWQMFDPIGFQLGEPHARAIPTDGAVRLDAPATPDPALGPTAFAMFRPELVFTDFLMSVDVLDDNSDKGTVYGLAARTQEPFVSYLLLVGNTDPDVEPFPAGKNAFSILRLDGIDENGLGIEVVDEVFFDLSEDVEQLKLVFRGEGSNLSGELFDLANPDTPLITLSGSDATYTAGYSEVVAGSAAPEGVVPFFGSSADSVVDNFSLVATQVPEPSSALLLGGGGLMLFARRRRQR